MGFIAKEAREAAETKEKSQLANLDAQGTKTKTMMAGRLQQAAVFAILLLLSILVFSLSEAAEMATCRVSTNDIGTIVGRGKDASEAFEDAATQCFDRRSKHFTLNRKVAADEETALVFIDLCANVQCAK